MPTSMSSACDAANMSAPRLEFAMLRCLQLCQSSRYAGEDGNNMSDAVVDFRDDNHIRIPLWPYLEVGANDASLIAMRRKRVGDCVNGKNSRLGMCCSYLRIALAWSAVATVMVEPKRCWMVEATNVAGGHAACPTKLSDPAKERIDVISSRVAGNVGDVRRASSRATGCTHDRGSVMSSVNPSAETEIKEPLKCM
jgi:hypothetical protein